MNYYTTKTRIRSMDLRPHAMPSISDIPGPEWAQMFLIYLGHLFVVTWHGIVRTLGNLQNIKIG